MIFHNQLKMMQASDTLSLDSRVWNVNFDAERAKYQ